MLERYRTGADMSRFSIDNLKRLKRRPPPPAVADDLLDAIGRGVVFTDPDGVVTYLNSAAEEMLQTDRKSIIGRKVYMLPLRTPVYKVLSENCRDNPVEIAVSGRIYAVLNREVMNRHGESLGEMTELWDVTQQKKEKRQWEEFVAMITHDLKSPVTVINGYLQMMKMGVYGAFSGRLPDVLEQMESSCAKLLSMIEDLLGSYRLEMGITEIVKERCDIGPILEECRRDNLSDVEEKKIDFKVSVEKGIPPLDADKVQLARAFNNLIGNALKFTPAGGSVSVRAVRCRDGLQVTVEDNGIGIPHKDQQRIFNRYFRSSSANGFKGTGLGLAITRAIVEAHGGVVQVESREGEGSRFTVIIGMEED